MFLAYFYNMCLFVAFVTAFWQMILVFRGRKPAGLAFETVKQKQVAFLFLFIYLLFNFLAELFSYTIAPGYPNQLVYSINILGHSFSLFVFFNLVLRTRILLYSTIAAWSIFVFMFFFRKYWDLFQSFNSIDIAGYFVIMGICSSIFLRQVLGRYIFQGNKFAVQLGTLCTVYFTLGCVTVSFTYLSSMAFASGDRWVLHINLLVNTAYYSILAYLFIRNIIRL